MFSHSRSGYIFNIIALFDLMSREVALVPIIKGKVEPILIERNFTMDEIRQIFQAAPTPSGSHLLWEKIPK